MAVRQRIMIEDALKRGFGFVEGADGFRADETFMDKFLRRLKEIVKEPELVLIEIIHEGSD